MLVLTAGSDNRISLEQLVDGSLDGAILTTTALDSTLPRSSVVAAFRSSCSTARSTTRLVTSAWSTTTAAARLPRRSWRSSAHADRSDLRSGDDEYRP